MSSGPVISRLRAAAWLMTDNRGFRSATFKGGGYRRLAAAQSACATPRDRPEALSRLKPRFDLAKPFHEILEDCPGKVWVLS